LAAATTEYERGRKRRRNEGGPGLCRKMCGGEPSPSDRRLSLDPCAQSSEVVQFDDLI